MLTAIAHGRLNIVGICADLWAGSCVVMPTADRVVAEIDVQGTSAMVISNGFADREDQENWRSAVDFLLGALRVRIESTIPIRGRLGSSGALAVAIVQASRLSRDGKEIVRLANELERLARGLGDKDLGYMDHAAAIITPPEITHISFDDLAFTHLGTGPDAWFQLSIQNREERNWKQTPFAQLTSFRYLPSLESFAGREEDRVAHFATSWIDCDVASIGEVLSESGEDAYQTLVDGSASECVLSRCRELQSIKGVHGTRPYGSGKPRILAVTEPGLVIKGFERVLPADADIQDGL